MHHCCRLACRRCAQQEGSTVGSPWHTRASASSNEFAMVGTVSNKRPSPCTHNTKCASPRAPRLQAASLTTHHSLQNAEPCPAALHSCSGHEDIRRESSVCHAVYSSPCAPLECVRPHDATYFRGHEASAGITAFARDRRSCCPADQLPRDSDGFNVFNRDCVIRDGRQPRAQPRRVMGAGYSLVPLDSF